MCPPFRPGAIQPGLRTYRTDPANRDRKRKGRSFEDEMGQQEDAPPGHHRRARPTTGLQGGAATSRKAKGPKDPARSDDQDDGRRHIDIEI